jgi:hypothetical protein
MCLSRCFVHFDRLINLELYKCYTDGDNVIILNNLHLMAKSGTLFMISVPLTGCGQLPPWICPVIRQQGEPRCSEEQLPFGLRRKFAGKRGHKSIRVSASENEGCLTEWLTVMGVMHVKYLRLRPTERTAILVECDAEDFSCFSLMPVIFLREAKLCLTLR